MNWSILIPILVLFLFYLAGCKRVNTKYADFKTLPVPGEIETKKGLVARAMLEIIAITGGIYLVLVSLVNFLQFTISETVEFAGVTFDPLAAIATAFAILQPFIEGLFKKASWK